MWKILAATVATVAVASACAMDAPPESDAVTLDEVYELAALDCLAEDDCEYPEQTLTQCLSACEAGAAAIEALCRIILSPAVREACWRVVYAGPTACSGFCYWYFTP